MELAPSSRSQAATHRAAAFRRVRVPTVPNKKGGLRLLFYLVPLTGLEPVQCRHRGILSYFSYSEPSGTYRILEEQIDL